MRINFFLSDVEEKNLRELLQKYGGKAPEYLRTLIKNAYEKEFGGYKAVRVTGSIKPLDPDSELSPEQLCEKYGGKIVEMNGTRVCRLPTVGESAALVPLTAHKDFKKYHKP